ncbi:MAG: hypothetical protein NTU70_10535 [Methylococcales bacterium]|nr:hypothetical protein [Methylococcales bacterium]
MSIKFFHSISVLFKINFYISAIVLVGGCLLSATENHSIFEFNEDLYGAIGNNIRVIMVYLAINELAILLYCFLTKNARIMFAVGLFLILLIGSLEFYAEINAIEFDQNLRLFFLYTGISHLVYGFIEIEKISPTQTNNEPK